MTQTAMMRDPSAAANTEYTIYTFQQDSGAKCQARWHRHDTLCDLERALEKAGSLFDSGDFCKVEIKQKHTDPKTSRVVDTTLKVLERKSAKNIRTRLLALMAAFGGGLAVVLACVLAGQS